MGSKRGPERILLGVIERAPDHRAAGALEVLESFIGRHLADEKKEAGRPRLQRLVRLLFHVLIVDPDVDQRAAERAPGCADSCARQRHQKKPADQHAPKRLLPLPRPRLDA